MDTTVCASAVLSVVPKKITKSHTCEEGGTHLRIFFWHLLVNLKNKLLLKKLLKWASKNKMILIFTMLHF